ncbi:MAG: L28 family ribosomal protein [Candidatus Azambacteria bacterium]|nr:L28 family ribosomal protein [Candidatus Azambacteria bacterium]
MPRTCSICGKGSTLITPRNKLRGKYNPAAKKRKYPNLQWMALPNGKRIRACTKCIKAMAKAKKK